MATVPNAPAAKGTLPTVPTDPLFDQQWYLVNDDARLDLNLGVWAGFDWGDLTLNRTGNRFIVPANLAILSDGFDFLFNPEIAAIYDQKTDRDFVDGDRAALPGGPTDRMGSALIGLAGGLADGSGIVGVAPGIDIQAIRISDDLDVAGEALNYLSARFEDAAQTVPDVVLLDMTFQNGFTGVGFFDPTANYRDGVGFLDGLFALMNPFFANSRTLFEDIGTVAVVRGAGDARGLLETSALVPGTAGAAIINVAAVRADGSIGWNSTPGSANLISAFGGDPDILTTDRGGNAGFGAGDHAMVGGSTVAAGQVAAVMTAMENAARTNDTDLHWRDHQSILALTARHVGSVIGGGPSGAELPSDRSGASWMWNGAQGWNSGGMHFSNDYGFGLIDAGGAIHLASDWISVAMDPEAEAYWFRSVGQTFQEPLTLTSNETVRSFSRSGAMEIEQVEVELWFSEIGLRRAQDLQVVVVSPDGTENIVINGTGGSASLKRDPAKPGSGYWSFSTHAFRGESIGGDWQVILRDLDTRTPDTEIEITAVGLTFWGQHPSSVPNGTGNRWVTNHVITDEFDRFFGQDNHRGHFSGGALAPLASLSQADGSANLYASARTRGLTLDFTSGTGTIDGHAVTVDGYNRFFGSQGNDIVLMGGLMQAVRGNGGNDFIDGSQTELELAIEGGAGDDILIGNAANGHLFGGAGNDTLIASETDTTASTAGGPVEIMDGGAGRDTADLRPLSGPVDLVQLPYSTDFQMTYQGRSDLYALRGIERILGTQYDDRVEITNTQVGGTPAGVDFEGFGGDDTLILSYNEKAAMDGRVYAGGGGTDWLIMGNIGPLVMDMPGQTLSGMEPGLLGIQWQATVRSFEDYTGAADGTDIVYGSAVANVINGGSGAGSDMIYGGAGDDILSGGPDDVIDADTIDGGAGNDVITGVEWAILTAAGGLWQDADSITGGDSTYLRDETSLVLVDDRARAMGDAEWDLGGATIGRMARLNFDGAGPSGLRRATMTDAFVTGNSPDLRVQGIDAAGRAEQIDISNTGAALIDLSGWRLVDWGGQGERVAVSGWSGPETLIGTAGRDELRGNGGDDTLDGRGGADILVGGAGDDVLIHRPADGVVDDHSFDGGAGHDTLRILFPGGTSVADLRNAEVISIEELVFADTGTRGNVGIYIGAGQFGAGLIDPNLEIRGIDADAADETLLIDLEGEVAFSAAGFGFSDWKPTAGTQRQELIITGSDIDNTVTGSVFGDWLQGKGGKDTLDGGSGDDRIDGGAGADRLSGGRGQDWLDGGVGGDLLRGGGGRDSLEGGAGNDRLFGNGGADDLVGGAGDDELAGGAGRDSFRFWAGSIGADRIVGFQNNKDTIVLDEAIWGGGLSAEDVLATFGSVSRGSVVLDFGGGDTITFDGFARLSALVDDIAFA